MEAHFNLLTEIARISDLPLLALATTAFCVAVLGEEAYQQLARLRSARMDLARRDRPDWME